jgi:hypothetical protein
MDMYVQVTDSRAIVGGSKTVIQWTAGKVAATVFLFVFAGLAGEQGAVLGCISSKHVRAAGAQPLSQFHSLG